MKWRVPIPDIPKSGLGGKASTDKAYALSHFVQSFDCHKNENRGPYPITKKELKMQNRYRNNQVHLDLSDDELALLNAKLRESKMKSKMEFLRHLILFSDIYVVDYKELQEYNFLLSNFTNNLNQIARVANSTGCIGSDDINKAIKLTEEVWRLQKSMLSKLQFRQP